jgi:hypothetical protein
LSRSRKNSGAEEIYNENILKQIRFKVGFLVFAVVLLLANSSLGQSSEDYKVYDAVIRAMFRDGVTQFDMNAKVDKIVIRDRTHSEYARNPNKEDWDQVKIRLRMLTDETIQGYESARTDEADLKSKFTIPLNYLLITDKQLHKIIPHPNGSMESWTEFYKVYPKSGGYNSFSRVGYDKARRNALVYFVNWCGSLCGTGTYVLLENGETGWAVKETAGMWIS